MVTGAPDTVVMRPSRPRVLEFVLIASALLTGLLALTEIRGEESDRLRIRRSKHFRIHHRNDELAGRVAESAEEHLARLAKSIAPRGWKRPRLETFHIRIYRDREEFIANGDENARSALALCVSPTELRSYESVILGALEHEITHLLVHAYLPSMPVWIQEGFATGGYSPASSRTYSAADRLIRDKSFLPMDRLVGIHSMAEAGISVDRYYLQARLALEFLIRARGGLARFYEFGRDVRRRFEKKLARMKRSVRRGRKVVVSTEKEVEQPVRDALASFYGYSDLAALDRDLHQWIRHRVRESRLQERQARRKLEAQFDYSLRIESPHFVLFSTSQKKLSKKLLDLSEKVYDEVAGRFWDAGILMPARMKVYVFDTGKEYAEFLGTVGMKLTYGKHLLPHYNPHAGAACTYRKGLTKDYLYQTVAHEVTHGLTASLFSARSGRWVQEAIAYYVGNSVHSRTEEVTLGECHETKLSRLASYVRLQSRTDKLIPLARLIEPGEAQDPTVARRAQAWALFRFLEDEEDERHRRSFHAYLKNIVTTGKGGVAEFETHVEPLASLEPRFVVWAGSLRATSKKR